jgi:hypothetical protein
MLAIPPGPTADQTLGIAVRGGPARYDSRLWRLRGECALARRRWDEAEPAPPCRALDIARALGEARQLATPHMVFIDHVLGTYFRPESRVLTFVGIPCQLWDIDPDTLETGLPA